MMAIADAVVVGAGIVGAACAAELSSAGFRVVVCQDTEVVGDGATAAGMGHIAVMDDSEAQFALTRYSQQLWDSISDELPDEVEHDAAIDIARSLARRLLKIRQIDSSHVFNSRRELISRKLKTSQRKTEPRMTRIKIRILSV